MILPDDLWNEPRIMVLRRGPTDPVDSLNTSAAEIVNYLNNTFVGSMASLINDVSKRL